MKNASCCGFLLLLVVSSFGCARSVEGDAATLPTFEQVIAAQQAIQQAQGTASYLSIDAEGTAGPAHRLQFYLMPPKRFHFVDSPVADPDRREFVISNGTTLWKGEVFFADEQPIFDAQPWSDEDQYAQAASWLRLNAADITARFSPQLQTATTTWQPDSARYLLSLTPLPQSDAPDVQVIDIVLDQQLRTVGMQTVDLNGVTIRLIISELDTSSELDPRIFVIE